MADAFDLTWLWCSSGRGIWGGPAGVTVSFKNSEAYTLAWICHGKATITLDGTPHEVQGPRDFILYRPWQKIEIQHDGLEPVWGHSFSFCLAAWPKGWPWPGPVKRRMPSYDVIRPLFEYVLAHIPPDHIQLPPSLPPVVKALLLAFIQGPVERVHMLPESYPPPLQRVLHWMRELTELSPHRKVSLDAVAAVAGVSCMQICRIFKEYIGYTPLAAISTYRIMLSLAKLRTGRKIESIAHELGFANAAHYALRFKAIFGISPSEMQRRMADGYVPEMPQLPLIT